MVFARVVCCFVVGRAAFAVAFLSQVSEIRGFWLFLAVSIDIFALSSLVSCLLSESKLLA